MSTAKLAYFLSWVPVGLVFADCVAFPSRVPSGDKANADALPVGSWVLVSRLRRGAVPERGDMVRMKSPIEPAAMYRRVVALDGDYVRPRGQAESDSRLVVVPAGSMWVEATTPADPETTPDSNCFGPVSFGLVQGRVSYSSSSGVMAPFRASSSRVIVPTKRYR